MTPLIMTSLPGVGYQGKRGELTACLTVRNVSQFSLYLFSWMSVSRPPLNKNMAARQAGVFVVVVLGLGAQLALLRHELSQGHRS